MKISYSSVWDDTVRMLRANASLLIAIAGVFLFLPSLLLAYLVPTPTGGTVTAQMMADYYQRNFVWIMLVGTLTFMGNLSILVLALDDSRPTVAGAIQEALRRLWRYFTVSLIGGVLLMVALLPALIALSASQRGGANAGGLFAAMALMIPALYLAARLAPTGPVVVAEPELGAISVVKRSFSLSQGAGWSILGLILIVCAVFVVLNLAATLVFGSIFLLADRAAGTGGLASFLLAVLSAAISAGFNVVLVVLLASIYRRLTASPSSNGI